MTVECFIYLRVSSSRQVKEGNGLESQERKCIDYSLSKNYKIIQIYKEEGVSGQEENRPKLSELINSIKSNYKERILVVDDLSRLSRNIGFQIAIEVILNKHNVKLETVNMAMPDGAAGNFLKNILGATNQFFAQHNQIQVVSRMNAQMQAGRWILKAPFGYENYHHPVEGKIVRPKQIISDIVREMLNNYSVGTLKTIADAQRFLSLKINTSDYQKNYRNKQASRILNNALFYAGHIRYKRKDKILPFKVWDIDTKGIHKPLISMETAYKILERLKKKERIYDTSKKDLFPLKNNILCFGCGSKMTANHSTSKSKKKFGYYRCNNFNCNHPKKNINQTFAEEKFSKFLKSIEFDNSYKNFISAILDKILKENKYKDTNLKRKITKSINELEISKKHLLDKLSDENFYSIQQDIVKKIDSINFDIKNANKSLIALKDRYSHKFYLDQVLDLFTNLNQHWSVLNVESKRNLQNLLFPDGFSINLEGEITTPQICVPFARFRDNFDKKSNLVDQVSRNWNTYYLLLLKWKEHLQNAQYITINQQNQDIYDAGIVDY